MFTHHTVVRMRDTDAAGIVYFARYFAFAHEAYEAFLEAHQFNLADLLETSEYLIPIVHAEAQYHHPLRVQDTITVKMRCDFIGESSFTLEYQILRQGKCVCNVKTTHATVKRHTLQKVPIPSSILQALQTIYP